jgi:hypothetical protein
MVLKGVVVLATVTLEGKVVLGTKLTLGNGRRG